MEGWTQFAEWRQEDRQLRRLIDRIEDALREWEKEPKDENLMMGGLLAQVRQEWQNLQPYLEPEPTIKDFYQRSDAHEQDRIAKLTESKLREQAARVLNLLPVQPLDALVLAIQTIGLNLEQLGEEEILAPVQESLNEAMKTTGATNAFQGHGSFVNSVAFSPDGRMIVSGSHDKTIRLWGTRTGKSIGEPFQGHESSVNSVAFSPNGRMIVSGSYDKTIRLWDTRTGKSIGEPFQGHESSVNSVAFSPDGQMIVSGSRDTTVRLWDIRGKPIDKPFWGYGYRLNSVAFSPDGQMIVSGGWHKTNKTVWLWNTSGKTMGKLSQQRKDGVNSVAFSPDGQWIASGGNDGTLQLWDTKGKPIGKLFRRHTDGVNSVTFSPDGHWIISASNDGTLQLWDTKGNPIGQPFQGHESQVRSVAFSSDGQWIVSGGNDGTLQLWGVGWKSCLHVCCNRLRYHPVFKNPQTEVEKQACETCQKYVWSQEES
jgi:WD40 repeat protein